MDGLIHECYSIAVTRDLCHILGCEFGTSSSQQALEALAILVALRQWHNHWESRRARLTVRSDSVSALALVFRFKSSATTSLIAQELALDAAQSLYLPSVGEHLPGIANVTCDVLSRMPADASLATPAAVLTARR
eukprot:1937514-Amphidinium_carterae.1